MYLSDPSFNLLMFWRAQKSKLFNFIKKVFIILVKCISFAIQSIYFEVSTVQSTM